MIIVIKDRQNSKKLVGKETIKIQIKNIVYRKLTLDKWL